MRNRALLGVLGAVLGVGLAGCPAFLSDDWRIVGASSGSSSGASGSGSGNEGDAAADAGSDASPTFSDAGCSAGTLACNLQQPEFCTSAGTWQNVATPCSGSTPVCLAGACVQCQPASTQCSLSAVETCNQSGQWGSAMACPQPTPECGNGACSAGHDGGTPITLASGQHSPGGIAVDATSV